MRQGGAKFLKAAGFILSLAKKDVVLLVSKNDEGFVQAFVESPTTFPYRYDLVLGDLTRSI